MLEGACRGVSVDVFYPEQPDFREARMVCRRCPVRVECLDYALGWPELFGVWGGQLFINGKMLTVKRRRGRPPKVARPEDQMPVVPIPVHLQVTAQKRSA